VIEALFEKATGGSKVRRLQAFRKAGVDRPEVVQDVGAPLAAVGTTRSGCSGISTPF
jgi:hypothetical protein